MKMKKTGMTCWNNGAKLFLTALLLCVILLLNSAAAAQSGAVNYTVEILPETPRVILRKNAAHDSTWYTKEAVYSRLMAMNTEYTEGMTWTNDNSYANTYLWHGGEWDGYNLTYTGYGCAGFALIMSDAAFGTDVPIWQEFNVPFSGIRIGDILRINSDTHSVIVLEVNSDSVTIAEGNYGGTIHWGRTLSAADVEAADYVLTRWPGVSQTFTVSYDAAGGTGAPEEQTKIQEEDLILSSIRPVRDGYYFLGWAESADAATAVYQPGETFTDDADTTLYAVWAAPDLVLPDSLTDIRDEAFTGGAFCFAKLPEETVSIGTKAFANCKNLQYVYIPASVTSISPYAFSGITDLTVFGPAGSAAEEFALNQGFRFVAVP